ncbi:MAG TPA: HlyD family efflux transporter periplasmic adaptor subunit [Candidatus Methylomirabilis sp.]|nr:HlyD family efflux transporter periplasmic adaptor subunit [Candidatus Methylomirabilis sp.]
MRIPKILKRKSTYIALALVAAGAFWFQQNRAKRAQPVYETATVSKQDLAQTVEVTGEIKPAERIELSFDRNGTVDAVNVRIGNTVKKGDVLAQLKNDDVQFALRNAQAALAKANATLNQKIAGYTKQEIRIAETNVTKAKAAYDKSVTDLAATKLTVQDNLKAAQITVESAKNKLDNQSASLDQNLRNSLETSRIVLLTALGPLHTGLTDGDAVIGVDDTVSNDSYERLLGITDSSLAPKAKTSYLAAKAAKNSAEAVVEKLGSKATRTDIASASDKVLNATLLVQIFLGDVQKILAGTIPSATFTANDLAAKKATIDADRTNVSAQNTAILNAMQAVTNVELTNTDTKQQLFDAHNTAVVNYDIAKTKVSTDVTAAESNVAINRAALDSAQADLEQKKAPAREADLAPLRAAVQEANVALDKATNDVKKIQIIAPVDGTIADVVPSPGEQIAMNAVAVKMVGVQEYDIEALIPEADIAKVKAEQTVTVTLDAYGDDVAFDGTVLSIEPDQTKVQDAVYYKTRIIVVPAGRDVKPGMTANVTILTKESKGVLVIPLRAVRTKEGTEDKIVRMLEGDTPQEVTVELGLRGDEGRVEVTKGLQEGQTVILSEKSN